MQDYKIAGVILAAGKGTRMKSNKAKVMHEVFFEPMIHHVLNAVAPMKLQHTVVVTGHQADLVEGALADFAVVFARQAEQLGTADAVLATREVLQDFSGQVLILCGDTPLIRPETIQALVAAHSTSGAKLSVLTTIMADPKNYGRIITDESGNIRKIVEEKDASPAEKAICEINTGIYCVDTTFLFSGLGEINTDNSQGEFYLTDLVEVAGHRGLAVNRQVCDDPAEVLGVNSRVELAEAHRILQKRRNYNLMLSGVSILGPDSVDIANEVKIKPGCEIGRCVTITGNTVVGSDCQIGSNTVIEDCRVGEQVRIGPSCCLGNCNIDDFSVLKAGTRLFDNS